MVTVIKDIILRLGLDREKLLGQCCDGYSTMMGKIELKLERMFCPLLSPHIAMCTALT